MKRLFAFSLIVLAASRMSGLEYFVAPTGSDTNPGTMAAPFATITMARDTIRSLNRWSGLPSGGVTVWLRGGYYNLTSTIVFDSRDSGAAGSPIVYAAANGEQVYITGAMSLDPSWFTLVTSSSPVWNRLDPAARGNVYAVNLTAHGITDFGTLKTRGFKLTNTAPMELFSNGQPMTLARWPNRSDPMILTNTAPSNVQVTYLGSRPERWTQATDIWAQGFWYNGYADYHLLISGINTGAKTITFAAPPPQYGLAGNRPFYVYNLLEEIDTPGEYYIDRTSGILYYWPTGPLATSTLQVSMLENYLLQLTGAKYVTFRDLVLEASRASLLRIDSASSDRLERCVLRNAGQLGALINGYNSGLDQCEVANTGEDGVSLIGGSRATLASSNNFVTNSRLHDTARIAWTYHPAIGLTGCGSLVGHNLIDELPHAAIIFAGNNHVIEYNEIRRTCLLATDAGAVYSDRDWGFRGNIIRYNFIHHVTSLQGVNGTQGVYLDDCMSSALVFGNVFYRISGAAITCGGGRDNIMENNLFVLCDTAHYGGDYARASINNTPGSSFNLLEKLAAEGIQYQQPPWATAYPSCAAIPNSWTLIQQGLWRNPQGCIFSNNAGWGNTHWTVETNKSGTGVFSVYASMANNNPAQTALFDENASVDRSLRPATLSASVAGFVPIPLAQIGPAAAGPPPVTRIPPVPLLEGRVLSSSQVDLDWTDNGNLGGLQESGFDLERKNEPDGSWLVIRSSGPDVNFASATGLAPATTYSFRVRAFNSAGSVYSNNMTVTTAVILVPGTSTRIEAESPLTVLSDVGSNGAVGISKGTLDSQKSVKLYDVGDAIRVSFATVDGLYRLGARVRTGGAWPAGYSFKLDGNTVVLVGDPTTVSALDPAYGGCYWGTMYSSSLTLTAGTHTLDITSGQAWGVADYLEVTPLVVPACSNFGLWQGAHFSADQMLSPAISGWSARLAASDLTNLFKYSLGLDPWTKSSGSGVQVSLAAGMPRLTYTRPIGLTDVGYLVQTTDNGDTWTTVPQVSLGQANGIVTMQATESPTAHGFIQLRVTCGSWVSGTDPLQTGVPPGGATPVGRVEAESQMTVLSDLGIKGSVGIANASLDSGMSVRLYDPGDAIRIPFTVAADGTYRIGVRVRAGAAFWPNGYSFKLDGQTITLAGDSSTLSALDPSYGGCYWGTMYSGSITLTAGQHSVDVTAATSWAVVDYLEIAPATAGITIIISNATKPTTGWSLVFNSRVDLFRMGIPVSTPVQTTPRMLSLFQTAFGS